MYKRGAEWFALRLLDRLTSADESVEALEALFRVKGEQGRKKVVVTCFNWKCKFNIKTLSKLMSCAPLKRFIGELLCFLTTVLLLHKESSIWTVCFHSSVVGEGENYSCSSVIFNFKGIIVLSAKFKIKNAYILRDYSTCEPLEFSCLFWSLQGTSLMQVVGKVKPSFCGVFSSVLSSEVICYIQSFSCFMKTHQQVSLLPLQASLDLSLCNSESKSD